MGRWEADPADAATGLLAPSYLMSSWLENAHRNVAVHVRYFQLPRLSTEWEEWEWDYEVTSVLKQPQCFDKQTLEGSLNPLMVDEGASVTTCKSQDPS